MELKKLGSSNLMVSPICFGGNVFGWTLNEAESFKILDAFVANGYNFIDTANSYSTWVPGNSGGESETIIGKWMKKNNNRNKVVIATKLGAEVFGEKGLDPVYMKKAVEGSLKRLQTDHIDLYQSHYDDPETPCAETMEAFNDLIKEGKVRFIGASNVPAERIIESNEYCRQNGLHGYISLQPLYNLYDREKFENQYLQVVKDEKLAVMNYYSLASGFLSGKYKNEDDLKKSVRGKGIKKYLNAKGTKVLSALGKISAEKKVPFSAISIAWLLSKSYITSAIVSATSQKQLEELFMAVNIKLSPEELDLLAAAGN